MRGHWVQNKYTINFDKKIQEAMRPALSVSLRSPAPPKGELAPKVTERAPP